MRTRRWQGRDAELLCAEHDTRDPVAAMRLRASSLLEEAMLGAPPFKPELLASVQGIREVRRCSMSSAARLVPDLNGLVIEVNEQHSLGKQNFSIDHEVCHTLLPTFSADLPITDDVTGRFESAPEGEALCDIGASALLLPRSWLSEMAAAAGPTLETLFMMAKRFGASLEATARSMSELDLWPAAYVFWEPGLRKSQRVSEKQMTFLEANATPSEPPLRVTVACPMKSFDYFIPMNKSVASTSIISRAAHDGEVTYGDERVDLGSGQSPTLYTESCAASYKTADGMRTRVISFLLRAKPERSFQGSLSYEVESQ